MTRLAVVTVAIAVAALLLVVELLRRRRLREKYAVLWVVLSGATLILAVFPSLLFGAAEVLGIAVPSNFLFLGSVLVLFAVALQLSAEIGQLEEQSRRLAEEVAALRLHVDELRLHAAQTEQTDVDNEPDVQRILSTPLQ